jgi:hypothetical protein
MRKLHLLLGIICLYFSCQSSKNLTNIEPKSGKIEIPDKGELRVWNKVEHSGFEVTLTNTSSNQSCELYSVKSGGEEKWISPSLMPNATASVSIPANGHLYIKNFNPNILTIQYKINE